MRTGRGKISENSGISRVFRPTPRQRPGFADGTGRGGTVRTLRTIVAGPHGLALARLRLQVERPVSRTVRQTLQRVFVHFVAVHALPAFFADARPADARSVTATVRVRTIHCGDGGGISDKHIHSYYF